MIGQYHALLASGRYISNVSYIPWTLSSFLKDKDLNQLTYQDKQFVEDLI